MSLSSPTPSRCQCLILAWEGKPRSSLRGGEGRGTTASPRSFDWGGGFRHPNTPTLKFQFLFGFRPLYFENIRQCKNVMCQKTRYRNFKIYGDVPRWFIDRGDVFPALPGLRHPWGGRDTYMGRSPVESDVCWTAPHTLPTTWVRRVGRVDLRWTRSQLIPTRRHQRDVKKKGRGGGVVLTYINIHHTVDFHVEAKDEHE